MKFLEEPLPFSEALDRLAQKRILPTALSSAELREELTPEIRLRSLFSARTTKAAILQEYQDQLEKLLNGETNIATARMEIQNLYNALGYTPEHGFRGDEATDIPPAERGSLRDLSSNKRIDLVLMTNMRQCANYGFWKQGQSDFALFAYPCYELIRIYWREIPRGLRLRKGALEHIEGEDWPSRWISVGGRFYGNGRMIARKDDDIWGRLGDSAIFPDALDTFIPPFAFGSGYGWREVDRATSIALGVIGAQTQVEGQRHGLNEVLKAPANLTVEMIDAALADLNAYDEKLTQQIEAQKAKRAAEPKRVREPWVFTFDDGTKFTTGALAANVGNPEGARKGWDTRRVNGWTGARRNQAVRGLQAIQYIKKTKRDIPDAMHIPKLGTVDFRWQVGPRGMRRIIEDHKIARRIPIILAKGEVTIGRTRAFVEYRGHRVVLSNNLFDVPVNHWVLTGYRDKKKGNR